MSLQRKLEGDIEIEASASKFHELLHKRLHHVPKASGDKVQSCELHEGDWGKVGSIVYWNYFLDGKAKVGKHVIEAIDEEKNLMKFKEIEGDLLKIYKSFNYTIQAIPKGKGSVVHWTMEYEKLHENIPDSHSLLELCLAIAKDISDHIQKGN
ncbi:MLP-like protein 31 [Benincasa hispida]|uniref:MLP-like protein 31 n=1 Tax=Benincasa hispida TaxID=102211 RepID=UPI0018FFE23E|nr:MLP-like protein 31 [Benincasa hispida]